MTTEGSDLARFQRRLCSPALACAVILAVLFFIAGERAIGKGLVLGACFSVVNFLLLGKSVPLTLGRPRSSGSLIGLGSIFFRFALLAIPMVVAIKSVSFNFAAVVIGIFAVQIATIIDYVIIRPISQRR
jgi:ATP synthase protein I